jgi:tripartite-type tricarboxylate transporter receptor subunit TctC
MRTRSVLAAIAMACAATAVQAQSYPAKPVTMIVPFPPGGIADITGRPLAAAMARILGQSVVVENKAGAGGAVGMAYAARQPADGYTLLMALSSITIIPESDKVSGRSPSYQLSDFAPVALLSADPTVLLVRSESPWKTLGELVKDAKERPGKISYSTSGIYGTTHTAFEMFAQAANIKLLHVPYKGGGPAMVALLSGEVDVTAQAPGVANPHVKSGKVRVLGSWAAQRLPAIPDVPTLREQGFDAEFYIWAALFAPAATPPEVLAKLRAAARQAAQEPEFKNAMLGMNTPIYYLEGAEFERFLERDARRLAEVVKRIGKVE